MPITPSHRPTREWPLLLLALALVFTICIPLWHWSSGNRLPVVNEPLWKAERLGRLLLGLEQIACYCCFAWGSFILLGRYLEVRRQRRAFRLDLLPTEDGARILPEDARPLRRKVEHLTERGGPFVLGNMIRLALGKYAVSKSSQEVSDTVRAQAEVDMGRMVSSMSLVHYLAWALPAIGFLGTVHGLAGSLVAASQSTPGSPSSINLAFLSLDHAYDTTLVALVLSVCFMFCLHMVQRDEEALVIDCQQYCLEHLVNRLYDPGPVRESLPEPHPSVVYQ